MPSKEQIFSKLLFLINAPAQRLVTVMNAAGRDLAVVLNQAVEQGKFAAAAAPAKPAVAEAAPVAEAPKAEPVAARPGRSSGSAGSRAGGRNAPAAAERRSRAGTGEDRRQQQRLGATVSPGSRGSRNRAEDSQTAAAGYRSAG